MKIYRTVPIILAGLNWYGNWCGPGGAGPTKDCYDAACKRHDKCYEDCGIDYISRWYKGGRCAMACDIELRNRWRNCPCGIGASGSW